MSLTKEKRESLPDSDFAVPEKRELPFHDITHTKMAWNMVDKTKDLTDEERKKAKERILKRAKELGIDTDNWNVQAISDAYKTVTLSFEAMAVELPNVKDHPNKVPFSGILTRLDEPSDEAVGGAGKRIIIPKSVAEKALPTLLCMAVDFTPSLDGHDSQSKIGLITEANIVGNAIEIKGFFYGADFPNEVKRIQSEKAKLGFSYEAQASIRSEDDDPWILKSCTFTGAAVLYKNKAAYQSTSLVASAEKSKMSEEIVNLLKELKSEFQKETSDMKKEIAEIKANATKKEESTKIDASSLMAKVQPHANAVRSCASAMYASGIGSHPTNGHAAELNKIADHMEMKAAAGELPHVYQTNDFYHANADKTKTDDKQVAASKEVIELKETIDSLKTQITDLKAKSFHQAEQPPRKSLSAQSMHILKKIGINPANGEKISVDNLDTALNNTNISRPEAMALKLNLRAQGMLEGVN